MVHHSNYIRWFEEARSDFLEQIGISYAAMEQEGYISPVVSISCKYINKTVYGDCVYVIAKLESFNGTKYSLTYKVIDSVTKELRATGESCHCFLNKNGKPITLKRENKDYYDKMILSIGNEVDIE